MARGSLRIFLGAAPGVGKTYAMLEEAHRRAARGSDVVIGLVVDHDRVATKALLAGLEQVPLRVSEYRGAQVAELDVAAVIARHPRCVLVDEYAHSVIDQPGRKRWQDIEEILDAGIDVVSTVNIQHLESLGDVVKQITGVPQRETVPDDIVRRADQIQLVDMSPEALRRRLAHGNVYGAEKVDAALSNYFRQGNLAALRELALLWVADRVNEGLDRYRHEHDITSSWPTRERFLISLSGGSEGVTLVRHAARQVARVPGAELFAVYISRGDGLTHASSSLREVRKLISDVGGTFQLMVGDDVAGAVVDYAKAINATQIVVGTSRRHGWARAFSPGVGSSIIAAAGDIPVQMVAHEQGAQGPRWPVDRTPLAPWRRALAWGLAALGPAVLTTLSLGLLHEDSLSIHLMLYLALTVGVALVGGLWPAMLASFVSAGLANFFFTAPTGRLTIGDWHNVAALIVFILVGIGVSTSVSNAARRTLDAARAQTEAEVLATLSSWSMEDGEGLEGLLRRVGEVLRMDTVLWVRRKDSHTPWETAASFGPQVSETCDPHGADGFATVTDAAGTAVGGLAVHGRPLTGPEQKLLQLIAARVNELIARYSLRQEAAAAETSARNFKTANTLLAAVSHDVRTPLTGAKIAVSTLRETSLTLTDTDRADLLATIEESVDRLDRLLGNLLDHSRLSAHAVHATIRPVRVEGVVAAAVMATSSDSHRIDLDVPEDLPTVDADRGLLEQVLVNIIGNAVRHAGGGRIAGSTTHDRVEIRMIDHGPGIPEDGYETIFQPFQRKGDRQASTVGIGLGLSVARGMMETMEGTLTAEPTPGGGLTLVASLPVHRSTDPYPAVSGPAYPESPDYRPLPDRPASDPPISGQPVSEQSVPRRPISDQPVPNQPKE